MLLAFPLRHQHVCACFDLLCINCLQLQTFTLCCSWQDVVTVAVVLEMDACVGRGQHLCCLLSHWGISMYVHALIYSALILLVLVLFSGYWLFCTYSIFPKSYSKHQCSKVASLSSHRGIFTLIGWNCHPCTHVCACLCVWESLQPLAQTPCLCVLWWRAWPCSDDKTHMQYCC